MDTIKHADAVALEAGQTFAGRVKEIVPDAVIKLYGSTAYAEAHYNIQQYIGAVNRRYYA